MAVFLRSTARRVFNNAVKYQTACISSVPEPQTQPDIKYAKVKIYWHCNICFWRSVKVLLKMSFYVVNTWLVTVNKTHCLKDLLKWKQGQVFIDNHPTSCPFDWTNDLVDRISFVPIAYSRSLNLPHWFFLVYCQCTNHVYITINLFNLCQHFSYLFI